MSGSTRRSLVFLAAFVVLFPSLAGPQPLILNPQPTQTAGRSDVTAPGPDGDLRCPVSLDRDTRVRVTVPGRALTDPSARVAGCTASELAVTDRSGRLLSINWSEVTRLERARRRDFRWYGLAAGAAAGVWLGRKLPVGWESCYEIAFGTYRCPETTRFEMILLGIGLGGASGYLGGMLIPRTSWEVIPLATPQSLGVRVRF